ncbi:hypothetical protein RHMOL_Rhmol01G0143600 [Rhododendron molle]|uniref:Uncharacterized protein n=1 Tax=Rhododendron molle TaxID=49168 RepID=A0ACC0Q3B4_RHOML|nr:hypothetical protein RHMOL_Rhmol01G0143600 [Rhododendron molle]
MWHGTGTGKVLAGHGTTRHGFSRHADWHRARKWAGTARARHGCWSGTTRHGLTGHGHGNDTIVERARHGMTRV